MLTGEKVVCDRCNGLGIVYILQDKSFNYCDKCRGTRRVNWLQNIFGKPRSLTEEDYIEQNKSLKQYQQHHLRERRQRYNEVDNYGW